MRDKMLPCWSCWDRSFFWTVRPSRVQPSWPTILRLYRALPSAYGIRGMYTVSWPRASAYSFEVYLDDAWSSQSLVQFVLVGEGLLTTRLLPVHLPKKMWLLKLFRCSSGPEVAQQIVASVIASQNGLIEEWPCKPELRLPCAGPSSGYRSKWLGNNNRYIGQPLSVLWDAERRFPKWVRFQKCARCCSSIYFGCD